MPRRLRKIYVEEHDEYNSLTGETEKSYSFFVLPFAFAKDAPWTPEFDFERPQLDTISEKDPNPIQKSQTVTSAIDNKSVENKMWPNILSKVREKSATDKPTAPVIFLKSCSPPTFPHLKLSGNSSNRIMTTKAVPVKLAETSVNKPGSSSKQSVVITTDPITKKAQIRWASDTDTDVSKTNESDLSGVMITDVISLASNFGNDVVEEIVTETSNVDPISVDGTQTPTDTSDPMDFDFIAAEESETEMERDSPNVSTKDVKDTDNSDLAEKVVSEIVEKDSSENSETVESEPSKNSPAVEKEKSKNSETIEAEPSKTSSPVEKEPSESLERNEIESTNQSETSIGSRTILAIPPSSRVDEFWRRHCFATREELSYAREYEDENVLPKPSRAKFTDSKFLKPL